MLDEGAVLTSLLSKLMAVFFEICSASTISVASEAGNSAAETTATTNHFGCHEHENDETQCPNVINFLQAVALLFFEKINVYIGERISAPVDDIELI